MFAPLAHALLIAGAFCALAPVAVASDVSTDFEFTNLTGEFDLGLSPLQVFFSNGTAEVAPVPSLALSGNSAFLVAPGQTATIAFGAAALEVRFYLRDQNAGVNSVLTIHSTRGNIQRIIEGSETGWTLVEGTTFGSISHITLENTGTVGVVAIDDFEYFAMPEFGTSYCNSATLNSTGHAGEIRAFGAPLARHNSVTLSATDLPMNQVGLFLVSPGQGMVANPGGSQGSLCLGNGAPIGRYNRSADEIFNTGLTGRAHLILNLLDTPMPTGSERILAGQTMNFQVWYRDQNPISTSNFTNAITLAFL